MELVLSKLSIAFNCNFKVVERNVFEITGDITIDISSEYLEDEFIRVDKLRVVYNHDGLLEHVYNGNDEPDTFVILCDVERYVNATLGGGKPVTVNFTDDMYDYPLSDDNSINVYADILL